MPAGVRAEVAVHGPADCPVASLSAERGAPVTGVTWTRSGDGVVEEFRMDRTGDAPVPGNVRPLLDVGDERIYRFDRDADAGCACEVVESFGLPVANVRAQDGTLVLALHLADVETLRDAVADLDEVADRVEVRRLAHAAVDVDADGNPTLVDRGRLTERQREVLRTAFEMGYFECPREANATAVAAELGVGLSTLAEHLAAAQGKLFEDLLGD